MTETGIEQVKKLAESLTENFDIIVSSDLLRASQTAEIIAEKLVCTIEYNVGLRETNNGDYKNLTKKEFVERGCKPFINLAMDERYPNGESHRNFMNG